VRYSLLLVIVVVAVARADTPAIHFLNDSYQRTVSRVVDPEGKVDEAAVDAALRATKGELDACPDAGVVVLAWLAFEHGKVALVDLDGTEDRATRKCLMTALMRTTLTNSRAHVVAVVELRPRSRSVVLDTLNGSVELNKLNGGERGGIGSRPDTSPPLRGDGPRGVTIAFPGPVGDFGNLIAEEIDRVVKARAGVFRACYQKELNRSPGRQRRGDKQEPGIGPHEAAGRAGGSTRQARR
jgi:hypothetical protein